MLEIVQGSLEDPLDLVLADASGAAVDVSDATGPLTLHWRKPDGTVVDVALTNTNLATGSVRRTFATGDTDLTGMHHAQVLVPRAGGLQTFPLDGSHFRWIVWPKI